MGTRMSTVLPAGRFILREFRPDDAPEFAAAVRESMATVGEWMSWARADFSERDALDWFGYCDSSRANGTAHEFGIFTAESGGFIGGAGLNHVNTLHQFCNLGYWVRASALRQGAALAAAQALARYGFEQLGQARIEIVVADGNGASQALARKAGAVHECLARNRLQLHGRAVAAHVFALVPEDFLENREKTA
jgi:RimJ/RimL family protein N-acetyltransferase